ncbi:MAG: rod shape-determining protein MreD [Desulforhopalus sp.]
MMSMITFWLLGIGLIVAQTTLLQFFPIWVGRPDFVFILVTFCAYRFAWIPGVILVFTLGWVMDVVAGIHLGFYPLMCLLTFTALKLLSSRNPIKETTYQIPLVGLSYFLVQMFFYFIYSLVLPEVLPEWSWGQTLQRTIIVFLSAIPAFLLFNSLHGYVEKRRLRARPPRRRPRKRV